MNRISTSKRTYKCFNKFLYNLTYSVFPFPSLLLLLLLLAPWLADSKKSNASSPPSFNLKISRLYGSFIEFGIRLRILKIV